MTHSYWSGSLGLQLHLLERLIEVLPTGLMGFTFAKYGWDGNDRYAGQRPIISISRYKLE